jgi:hypothetical protein
MPTALMKREAVMKGDAGDGKDGEQRHLEPSVEERVRIADEQAERGEAEAVEAPAITMEQPADEIERQHGEGALHGLAEAGKERIGERQRERDGRERETADAETAADAEEECGEDAEVEARDHEQVKGAGALERRSQIGGEIRAVPGDHGGEHGRVFVAEDEPRRQRMRKRVVRELHQAAAGHGLEGMLQASEAALIAVPVDVEFFRFG